MAASRMGIVTDEEKQLLLDRYLDIVWIDDVTEVKCVRCDRVPIHHYVSNCLHLFCRNCRTVFSDGGRWRCPQCKEYVTELSEQHWELQDHIYQIRAHCPNKKYGCHYQGQLSTIPGHLKHCEDTREGALPAEFKGITLDTVVNQMMRLNGIVEAIQGEVRALREESGQKWVQMETVADNTQVLTQEMSDQREQLSHVKQTLKDVVEFKDESEKQWKRTETVEMKLDGLLNSIKVLTQDFNEHREKCDDVKQITEERVSSGALEMQQLRTQLQQQQTLIDTNTEQVKQTRDNCDQLKEAMDELSSDLLKKTAEWAHVEPLLKEMKEFRESETNWKQMKENNDDLTKDLKLLRWDLHEQKEQLANVKPILKGNCSIGHNRLRMQMTSFQLTYVNELKDNCKSNMEQAQQLETKVNGLSMDINFIVKDLSEQKEQLVNMQKHMTDANELRVKCEINWKQTEQMQVIMDEWTTSTQVLTQGLHEQKGQLAIVTHAVNDVEELRDECERHWEQTKKFNDDISSDLKIFKWDVHEQKKQLANVNILITEMKDKCESNCNRTEAIELKVNELVSNAQVLILEINEQKQQLANVTHTAKDVEELREECESHWEQTQKYSDEFTKDITLLRQDLDEDKKQLVNVNPLITDMKDKCKTNCDHLKTMEMKVEELVSNTQVLTQGLNEQKAQLADVKQLLQDNESSAAVEMQQLKSQLEKQATLINTNNMQGAGEIKKLNVTMEAMQSAVEILRANLERKWSEEKVQRGHLSRDLDDLKQQLVEARDRGSQGADDIQQLKWQLEGSVHALVNRCQVNLNGKQLIMAQTQMPHDALHSMTLLYQWHITDIKTKDGKWNDWRESEVFTLTGYDWGAKARICRGGWIYLQLIDYKETKTPIDTRSMPMLTVVIESQSETTQDKQQLTQQHSTHASRTGFITFSQSLDYGKDIYSCNIYGLTGPPYVLSNGMMLKLYIEPPSMARSFFSNNGILLWRLDNYKERSQMTKDDLIWSHKSPYFYTSPHGYRVLLTLRLSLKTVCGGVWFVKGEHDSSLTKLFPHRLTVTLFNHTDQSKNLVISQEGKEAYYTEFDFKTVSASSLESGGYVADDSLLIEAGVESL